MKFHKCVRALAATLLACPQMWGAAAPRIVYKIETVAGSNRNGDQGPAIAAQISAIQGMAMDRFGNLFLSDADNHRVRRVSPSGVITTIAGTGAPGFSGDGGPATNAQLNLPYGLAVDIVGTLYIADLGNQRVRRISPDGTIATVAGDGRKASSADGGFATQSSLLSPRNVAIDNAGTLYISEFEGHRVRRVGADGRIGTAAGAGQSGFRGDGASATSALLSYPAGLALDRGGSLYIADSGNNRIRKVYSTGAIGTVLGGSSSTALSGPIAVAVDSAGTIFAGDASFVVRAFTAAGKWYDVAGNAAPGFTGDGGTATQASLNAVHELVTPTTGGVYIADGVRVRLVDLAGVIRTYAGDGYVHAVGDGQSAILANLNQPLAVALDAVGSLFIADTGTQRVRQVARENMQTAAGTGSAAAGAEGTMAANTPLNYPMGVAVDVFSNLLIADTYNHRVRQVTGDGRIRTIAGTGTGGYGADGGAPLTTALRGPRGVCADRAGSVYIADTSNHRVLRVPQGGTVQTVAGNGSPGDAGDGGQARLAQLHMPSACQVDSFGNLYIADTQNHRIRKVSASGVISTVAGTGAAGFAGDGGSATSAQIAAPLGVAADDTGKLYVADTGNHRVRMVTPDGTIQTIAGNGTAGFAGDGDAALAAQLLAPAGVVLDGAGALYIADTGNQRVRKLTGEPVIVPPDPIVQPAPISVVNALSLQGGSVAPGEIVSIFATGGGAGLGPESGVPGGIEAAGLLANLVAGVEVRFDGVPAPLFYVQNQQINAQVPYTIAGAATTHIEVRVAGKIAGSADVPVVTANPALLPSIINPDGTMNGDASPVAAGSILTLYATGEGLTDGANIAGRPAGVPLAAPVLPVTVTFAGLKGEVLFAGSAPGMIGVMQINVRVPGGVALGKADLGLFVGAVPAPAVPIWLK